MNINILVAAISAFSAIAVAAITYWASKNRERETEWRKEKLSHYKEYISALSGTVGHGSTPESKKRYALAFNTVGLFASQEVIKCLHNYQELTRLTQVPQREHDELLTKLVLEIRRDLRLKPKDNESTFNFMVIFAQLN